MPSLSSNRGMQLSIGPATLPTLVDGLKRTPMATMLPLGSISRLFIPALPDQCCGDSSSAAKRESNGPLIFEPRQAEQHVSDPVIHPTVNENRRIVQTIHRARLGQPRGRLERGGRKSFCADARLMGKIPITA